VDGQKRHKRLKGTLGDLHLHCLWRGLTGVVTRACDGCRRRKVKCDAATTDSWPCSACSRLCEPCTPPASAWRVGSKFEDDDHLQADAVSQIGSSDSIAGNLLDVKTPVEVVDQAYSQSLPYDDGHIAYDTAQHNPPRVRSNNSFDAGFFFFGQQAVESNSYTANIPDSRDVQHLQSRTASQSTASTKSPIHLDASSYEKDLSQLLGDLKMDVNGRGM
jgi:hypothetical protein